MLRMFLKIAAVREDGGVFFVRLCAHGMPTFAYSKCNR